jgi:protein SCO1/2
LALPIRKEREMKYRLGCSALLISVLLFVSPTKAEKDPGSMTEKVGLQPNIGGIVDFEQKFTDSSGANGTLSSFIDPTKPTLLVPVYYDCPRLCGLLTGGVFEALTKIPLKMGQDYNLTFISIDPRENAELAAERKSGRLKMLTSFDISSTQFHYLVGEADPIRSVMSSIGFNYRPDGTEDFSHSAVVAVVSPGSKITHYFTGIEFVPRDLRLALVESSEGKVGDFIDKMLLYCFRFDHTKGEYTVFALNVMKTGGILTLIALAALYGTMWKRYRV